jgi:hypothetical protein
MTKYLTKDRWAPSLASDHGKATLIYLPKPQMNSSTGSWRLAR